MFNRSPKRQRPRRPIYTSVINNPLVDLQRMMITRNGIGLGTQDSPIGGSGRVNTAWFRLGYTDSNGIPGMKPATVPSDHDRLGSANVQGASIEWQLNGEVDVIKFKVQDKDNYNFKAFNQSVATAPGNTLTAFVRVLGLWMPLTSATGRMGVVSGTITPRIGSVAGFGFVAPKIIDNDGNIKDSTPVPDPVKVWNFASNLTGQVNRYCWFEPDNTGKHWLVSIECN